jgi:hypothetical protein
VTKCGRRDDPDADAYFAEDRPAGFVLLCRAKPRSDLRIRRTRKGRCVSTASRTACRRKTGEWASPY